MAIKLGLECKTYRNTATFESPTWAEVVNIKDLSVSRSKATSDVSVRASVYRLLKGTLREGNISFQMVYDPDQADYAAFDDAYEANESVDLMICDGDIETVGTRFFRAAWEILKLDETQNLEEAVMVSVELSPTYDTVQTPQRGVIEA